MDSAKNILYTEKDIKFDELKEFFGKYARL